MFPGECDDKIRFSLNDETGVLHFRTFEIADAPECGDLDEVLREYLVGRPLANVDLNYLQGLTCSGDGQCLRAVIRVVQQYQHQFLHASAGR